MSVDLKPTSSGVTSMNASSTDVKCTKPYYDFSKDGGDTVSFRHRASKAEESPGSEVDRELAAIDKITQDAMGGPSSAKGKNGQNSFDL